MIEMVEESLFTVKKKHIYFLVAVILIFSAGFAVKSFSGPGRCEKSTPNSAPSPGLLSLADDSSASKEEMGSKVISFLNERHLKFEGAEGEIADVRPYGDYLYLVNILIRRGEVNQPASIYVTKDGKLIFLGEGGGIVDLDETSGIDPQNAAGIQTVPPVQAAETEREIDISDAAYVSGPEDAAVVIIEFNDYQCPFCKRFRDQTLDQILEEYEGRIRYVLMDFPITSIHPQAFIAHVAARCAGDQGMYFEYHDKLFSNQGAWSRFAPESEEEVEELKMYASELGLELP
jgi:hypothetical protein